MKYKFIFDPQTKQFFLTNSKKGKQITLRYLYQLGGSTGQFDILNENILTNQNMTDTQRKKRTQKKKQQLKHKKIRKQIIEKQK